MPTDEPRLQTCGAETLGEDSVSWWTGLKRQARPRGSDTGTQKGFAAESRGLSCSGAKSLAWAQGPSWEWTLRPKEAVSTSTDLTRAAGPLSSQREGTSPWAAAPSSTDAAWHGLWPHLPLTRRCR